MAKSNFGNQEQQSTAQSSKTRLVTKKDADIQPNMVTCIKQVCKISRQVTQLSATIFQNWMIKKAQPWVAAMEEAHAEFTREQDSTAEEERYKMDPIQARIVLAMIQSINERLSKVDSEHAYPKTALEAIKKTK